MEKAVLKTLIYANIFDYPLTIREVHKWLIGKKANLRQVEKILKRLDQKSKIKNQKKYWFLENRKGLVGKRLEGVKKSQIYLRQAQIICSLFKLIPWVKLVGISGGLAMDNPGKDGDIDLFVITQQNRLWISRILMLFLLSLTFLRRKSTDNHKDSTGKFCLNMILEEDQLEQQKKDLFVAHEVLQMKVLWERKGIYHKFLLDNEWVFKFLPNWISNCDLGFRIYDLKKQKIRKSLFVNLKSIDFIENLAKSFQLWYMKKPKGMERIQEGAVYFHPNDYGIDVMNRFKQQINKVGY